ncbi:unnamed protein product [Adineta ricciae]|uniref:Uncharacterized protein n=1 Tax=Adineta ricciae TaxID=249248 RepID=A0A814LFH0_ADIRI|nr:unnamed protein product [Adineta ricciae]
MISSAFAFTSDQCVQAAADPQLSSAETHLLATLLSQEDQLHYHQINNIQLPQHVLYILHQLTFTRNE